uniref:NADH-ubiquinone oxidoreductase chain 4L n=1 Tax=Aleochara postica TaxID=2822418 RepID=A0A8A5RBZ3_9COLE|nr:NADH dehydrogenase subunit 4L [Aleochara postica]QTG39872.1 NADH dehydrogenase subunit 4L [Aleochara postica]
MMIFFSMFMYMCGLVVFSMKRKHLLLMLLSLEFIIISLYFSLFIILSFYSSENYFSMIFLTMSVCEGVLGLSILVSMLRMFGNDYFQSFNMLW